MGVEFYCENAALGLEYPYLHGSSVCLSIYELSRLHHGKPTRGSEILTFCRM